MKARAIALGLGVLSFAIVELAPREAKACGGCFVPPESSSVVTDHRMALTISKDKTTLYDQIRYSGEPASFAWVLPIVGTVEVGLSADSLFGGLDSSTRVAILPPPRNCPPPPKCENERGGGFNAAPSSAGADGVTVLAKAVVGPYETVQLRSTDPAALANWLSKNGFTVPADVQPIVAKYVTEHFDFLALKLIPGKGVQDMRPVRVSTPGASPVLPLRMVAAGTGANVGITLWVVGEGRYEAQNFTQFYIPSGDIAWDWKQNRSNYTELRKAKNDAGGGKLWELEASIKVDRANVAQAVKFPPFTGGPVTAGAQGYDPVKNEQGVITKTSVQVADEDIAVLFAGIPSGAERITRIRADLAHAALDKDLSLQASADQGEASLTRQVTHELNQPICPVYSGCNIVDNLPRDEAIAAQDRNNGTAGGGGGSSFACSTTTTTSPLGNTLLLVGGLGFLGLAIARKRLKG